MTEPVYSRQDILKLFKQTPLDQVTVFNEGMSTLPCVGESQHPQATITTTVDWDSVVKHIKEYKKFLFEQKKKKKAKMLEMKIR